MSATSPDAPSGPSAGRRRRAQLVLVASALVVVAAAVGTSLAIATRPIQRPAAADAAQASAATGALALDDGDHDAYVTGVDAATRRIVVDVIQVFHDARA